MDKRFEKFTYNITKLYRFIQKIKELEVRDYNLKSQHVMVLYYLFNHQEGLTFKELTKLCDEDKAAMSRSIKFLEEQKLLIVTNESKKKSYLDPIILTELGKEIASEINKKVNKALDIGSKTLTEAQRVQFYNTLDQIIDNLNEYYIDKGNK